MRYYTSDSQQERSRFCTPNVQIEREESGCYPSVTKNQNNNYCK